MQGRTIADSAFTPKLLTVLREGYGLAQLKADAIAGLTVAIIALPLAMALAIASGASPEKGLITAIVAGGLVSALGGSRVQIGGPTGAFVVVVFGVIVEHGYDGLVLATLLAGLILILAGYAGLGRIIRYIPHPVITGFTAGIAVVIATSQINDFFGLRIESPPADFIEKWQAYASAAPDADARVLVFGLASLGLILLLRRFAPRLPAFLIVVLLASAAAALPGMAVDTIGNRFPGLDASIPPPAFPSFSLVKLQEVVPSAFTIAFLAGIEALLSCVVADGMTGFRHKSNQELVGQGAANIASALFAGLPATGAIARTAANIKSGGRTPFAGLFHAGFLLLFVLFAGDLMSYVPMATLAAVLLVVAWGMSEAERFARMLKMPVGERSVLVLTFLLTVLVDLTVAIGVGVTLASLMFVARMSDTAGISGRAQADDASEDSEQRDPLPPDVEVLRISGPFFFGVAGELLDALKRIGRTPRAIILRLEDVPFLDASGAMVLHEFIEQAQGASIKVVLCGLRKDLLLLVLQAGHQNHGRPMVTEDYAEALAVASHTESRRGGAPAPDQAR